MEKALTIALHNLLMRRKVGINVIDPLRLSIKPLGVPQPEFQGDSRLS